MCAPIRCSACSCASCAVTDRAPVAAVHGERSVAEDVAHQSHPQRGGGTHRDTGLGQWARQRVSRQRRYDHVEGVGRIAAVRPRIAQRPDHAVEVPERPRPAVCQHQRQCVRRRAPGVDVVDRHVVEHDAVVLELVERALERGEVEFVAPVRERVPHPLLVRTVAPVVVAVVTGPPRARQTVAEIRDGFVRDLDSEALGLHAAPPDSGGRISMVARKHDPSQRPSVSGGLPPVDVQNLTGDERGAFEIQYAVTDSLISPTRPRG